MSKTSAGLEPAQPPTCRPLVSVIMPAHNANRFIRRALESVRAQTVQDWELIVVDDASLDDTYSIVEQLAESDDRLNARRLSANCGAAVARNTAIAEARGRYIAFLDSDDWWIPDKLAIQLAAMRTHSLALSYTWYQRVDERGNAAGIVKAPRKVGYRRLLMKNYIGCSTVMYDTVMLGKRYMPNLRKRQDYGLWLDIAHATTRIELVPFVGTYYQLTSDSLSSSRLRAASYNWYLYRKVERLGRLAAAWSFTNYSVRSMTSRLIYLVRRGESPPHDRGEPLCR